MRGTPSLQAIVMIAIFLLAGWPVYRLTRPAVAVPATTNSGSHDTAPAATSPATDLAKVTVVCASAPTDFSITYTGELVLSGKGPQARFSKDWSATIPAEGADLVISARWPVPEESSPESSGANPAVARVTIQLADGRRAERSFWAGADGALKDVLTIPATTDTNAAN